MKSIFAPFCTVIEARDGMEALEICAKSHPDLIVTDVMMPNVSCRLKTTVKSVLTTNAARWIWSLGGAEAEQGPQCHPHHYAVC